MNHFAKIAAQLESRDLDGMLLTHEANRFYASGFHSAGTDGMALVTREKFYYFTDSRYTEAARRHVQDAEVQEAGHGRGYSALLMEAVQRHSIQRLGFEDAYMTVREHDAYARALPCELVPAADLLAELRAVKDPEELEIMIAAQRIAEKASISCSTTGRRTSPSIPLWCPAPTEACPTGYPRKRSSRPGSSSPWTSAASITATAPT